MRYGINDPWNHPLSGRFHANGARRRSPRVPQPIPVRGQQRREAQPLTPHSRAQYLNAVRAEQLRRDENRRRSLHEEAQQREALREEALRREQLVAEAASIDESTDEPPTSSRTTAQSQAPTTNQSPESPPSNVTPITRTTNAADYVEEARQRIERASRAEVEQQRRDILRDMLVVYDDLDRTLTAAETNTNNDNPQMAALIEGITMVRDRFIEKLAQHGAQLIDSDGAPFDPQRHEAIGTTPVEPDQDGIVVHTIERGFVIGEELLRPARVMVGKAP